MLALLLYQSLGGPALRQQRVKCTGALETIQLITPTYMLFTNPDLRHGCATGSLCHLLPSGWIAIYRYLLILDPFLIE
jgi:hypothetical protein